MYVLFWIVKLHSIKGNENKPKKVTKINKNNIKSIWKHVCPTYAIPGLRFCLRFWRGVLRFSLRFPMKCEQFSGLTSWFLHRGLFSKIIYIYSSFSFFVRKPLSGIKRIGAHNKKTRRANQLPCHTWRQDGITSIVTNKYAISSF